MLAIAHVGHDLVSLAFFVPTIAFIVWLAVTQVRQRRETRADGGGPAPEGGADRPSSAPEARADRPSSAPEA